MMDEWVSLRTGGRESWDFCATMAWRPGRCPAPALLTALHDRGHRQHQCLRAISAWMRRPCSGFHRRGGRLFMSTQIISARLHHLRMRSDPARLAEFASLALQMQLSHVGAQWQCVRPVACWHTSRGRQRL